MLEVFALCSCVCLACLWCATTFIPLKGIHRKRRIYVLNDRCNARRHGLSCYRCIESNTRVGRKTSYNRLQPVKLICKVCLRDKHKCVCRNWYCRNRFIHHPKHPALVEVHESINNATSSSAVTIQSSFDSSADSGSCRKSPSEIDRKKFKRNVEKTK